MTLTKIISGGQTGADIGALFAGRNLGISTGGAAPKGWLTERGPQGTLLRSFDLHEHTNMKGYAARTLANVMDSDATLLIGRFDSRGTAQTRNYCTIREKPWHHQRYDCYAKHNDTQISSADIRDFLAWLQWHKVCILNVAGNRESKNSGIQEYCQHFLEGALS